MKRRFNKATLAVLILAAFMGAVYLISLFSSLSWINKPFAGFVVYYSPHIGSLSLKEWPGAQAGLKYLDRIVAVDGHPVRTGQDIVDTARSKIPGTRVRYVVESGTELREIGLPVVLFGVWDFVQTFQPTYLCGVAL